MKLRIAYILKMYPRFSETFIVNEILELERRGVDVRIYSLRKPDDGRFHESLSRVRANVIYVPQYPEMEAARIRDAHRRLRRLVPDAYARVYEETKTRGHRAALKRFLQAGYVAEHLQRHPVHAMHAHFATSATRVASLVNQLIDVPYSVTAHAKDIYHESVNHGSLRRKLAAARFVVTVSHFNQQYLATVMGDEWAVIRTLYNGIDLRKFRPGRAQRQANLILGVGRLVEKKGFHVLIDACARLRQREVDFACHIVGKGELEGQLRSQIRQLGLDRQVRLVGPRAQSDVLAAYRRATVFALPCVIAADGNRDGLPTVILEAMATGLPVVSTRVTGVPEMIEDGSSGLLVQPGDPEALATALAGLLRDPDRRAKLATGARRRVEQQFDIRRNVGILVEWLAEPVAELSPLTASYEEATAVPLPELPVPMPLDQVFAVL